MVDKLFEAIAKRTHHLVEIMNLFGEDYWLVDIELREINGMQEAFKIIAGHSYTDHLINM